MIDRDVDYIVRRMMEDAGLTVGFDRCDFPPVDRILCDDRSDSADAFSVVDDCMVVVCNRYGTGNQVTWGDMQSPFSCPLPLDNPLVSGARAENGALATARLLSAGMVGGDIAHIVSIGCSMDADGRFTLRPYYAQVGSGEVVRMPVMDDFSQLSPRNIGDYTRTCTSLLELRRSRFPDLSAQASALLEKLRKWRVPEERLMQTVTVVLLAMGNPYFSRTLTQDAVDPSVFRECAMSWVTRGEPYTVIPRESKTILKEVIRDLTAVGRVGVTNLKGISRFIDTELAVPVWMYHQLLNHMVADPELPVRAEVMATLLDADGKGPILDPHCRNSAVIGACARHVGSSGRNIMAVCDTREHNFDTVAGLLMHGMIFFTVDDVRRSRQRLLEEGRRARHIVSDLVGQGDELDLLYRSMEMGSSGCTGVFSLSHGTVTDTSPRCEEMRALIASRWTIESITYWRDCAFVRVKKTRNRNGAGTRIMRSRNVDADTIVGSVSSPGQSIWFVKTITDSDWSL